jgi:hypothetical protein
MKYLYFVFIAVLLSFTANAQVVGIDFNTSVPTGDFGNTVNVGFSGGVHVEVPVFGMTGVLYGGYGFWDEKTTPIPSFSVTNFPVILAGARSYYGKLYLSTLAGIYPVKVKTEEIELLEETQGAIQVGAGYLFPVSFFHLDLSGNFLWTQDYSQVQFGVGILLNK